MEQLIKDILVVFTVLVFLFMTIVTIAPLVVDEVPSVETTISETQIEMIQRVAESCVLIEVTTAYGGWSGSGFIVSEDGMIVTAGHVVEGAMEFTVTLNDGREFCTFDSYKVKNMDCGVIKIHADGLPFVEMREDMMVQGEAVLSMGWPLGRMFGLTVSEGIASGVDRHVAFFGEGSLLQVDLEVNGGNSGGPLIDSEGRAIGIIIGNRSDCQSLTFCTPINIAILAIDAFWAEIQIDELRY